MLFKKKKDIVGIDIGSSAVKVVQLRESKGIYYLVNLGVSPLPSEAIVDNSLMDPGVVSDTIRKLLESMKIKSKGAATSISGHSVIIRKIQLPIMTEEEVDSSIQFEAEQYIPFDVSEVNLDFQIIGPDPKDPSQMNVVLVAAKRDYVDDYISVLQDAGLNPAVLDVDCFAVENMFEAGYGFEEGQVVSLIDMGATALSVNILKSGVSVFTRDIQGGGELINEELQKRLGLSSEDAELAKLGSEVEGTDPRSVAEVVSDAVENLAQEVQRSVDFFSATATHDRVDKVFVTGGASKSPGLKEALERRLKLPIDFIDTFRGVVVKEDDFDADYLKEIGPLMSVATGLAMRRVGDK